MGQTKEELNESCPHCDAVLDPIEVDANKFFGVLAGLQVCPECHSIVTPCNSCMFVLKDTDWCGRCPYLKPGIEVVNVEKFKTKEGA